MNVTDYTHPEVLAAASAGATWADPATDPTTIDWPARQARAAISFRVVDGRPVNPCESTGIRHGRNQLGHWGEQQCADALVRLTDPDGGRWLLMVERGDGHGWALPGGTVEVGERAADAAVRELVEETGFTPPAESRWRAGVPRYVPDPRASDEAWMVTTVATLDLGVHRAFPPVTGADDARRAAWVRADSYAVLERWLAAGYGGRVFRAHVALLAEALA